MARAPSRDANEASCCRTRQASPCLLAFHKSLARRFDVDGLFLQDRTGFCILPASGLLALRCTHFLGNERNHVLSREAPPPPTEIGELPLGQVVQQKFYRYEFQDLARGVGVFFVHGGGFACVHHAVDNRLRASYEEGPGRRDTTQTGFSEVRDDGV